MASYVEVECEDVSAHFPRGWHPQDLETLAATGHLRKAGEWQNPADKYGRVVYYEMSGKA